MARSVTCAFARTIIVAISLIVPMALLSVPTARAAGTPGPPTNVTAAAGDGVVLLSWLPPADDGGFPITEYNYSALVDGVVLYTAAVAGTQTSVTLGYQQLAINDLTVSYTVRAWNDVGSPPYGPDSEPSAPVTPRVGAPLPQTALTAIPPGGGSATTDPGATGPTASDPVTTAVTVPPTAGGGTLSIAESTPSEAPTGFVFLGQEIVIVSSAATDALNPLQIVFRVDPSLVPATVFRNGAPVEAACDPVGTATPSPCIAAGAGTTEVTVLTASASVWNVGLATYAFDGFFSPVDNAPVANGTKAGSVIPIRFGLGRDGGLGVLATGYPLTRRVSCDPTVPFDSVEETVIGSPNMLTYSPGTGRYQLTWKTDRVWAGTCRDFVIKFRDGTEAQAVFRFR